MSQTLESSVVPALRDQRIYPCTLFFSHQLEPAEKNYDVGNWELLGVKLALEEW